MDISKKATEFARALTAYNNALDDQHRILATRPPAPLEPAALRLQAALRDLVAQDTE